MADPKTGCTCGSGGHPRQCDLRGRRRFIQHEAERRFLHSSYGANPLEHLFEASGGMP